MRRPACRRALLWRWAWLISCSNAIPWWCASAAVAADIAHGACNAQKEDACLGGSGKRTNSRGGGSVEPLAAAELSDNAIADAVWEAADAARAAVRSTPLAACALLDGGGSSDAALATDADGYATPEVCSSLLTFYIGMQARCKGVMLNVSFLCYCAARPGPGAAAETSGATCLCSNAARASCTTACSFP